MEKLYRRLLRLRPSGIGHGGVERLRYTGLIETGKGGGEGWVGLRYTGVSDATFLLLNNFNIISANQNCFFLIFGVLWF